jgi:hypothetical protein
LIIRVDLRGLITGACEPIGGNFGSCSGNSQQVISESTALSGLRFGERVFVSRSGVATYSFINPSF